MAYTIPPEIAEYVSALGTKPAEKKVTMIDARTTAGVIVAQDVDPYAGVYVNLVGTVSIRTLSPDEYDEFERFMNIAYNTLRAQSPVLAEHFMKHKRLFRFAIEMFKGRLPIDKTLKFPPESDDQIGIALLVPQAIKYSTTVPSDYDLNEWTITLEAGVTKKLLGDPSSPNWTPDNTDGARKAVVICVNGLLEVETTPAIQQLRFTDSRNTARGIFMYHKLQIMPIEPGKPLYAYYTPAYVLMPGGEAIGIGVRSTRTYKAVLPLLGVVIYEYGAFKDFVWIS